MKKIFLGLILVFSFSKAVDSTFYATKPNARLRSTESFKEFSKMYKKIVILLAFTLFFTGCATKTEYKEIFIPTKCEIPYPQMANKSDDIVENQRNLVIYTLELENALNCCIKGEC